MTLDKEMSQEELLLGEEGNVRESIAGLNSNRDLARKRHAGDHPRPPLPAHLLHLRKKSFSVFVSNLSLQISKLELEAMFCRVGRIVDSFIPVEKSSGNKRGFAFKHFGTKEGANRAVAEGNGRSWGGKENSREDGQKQFGCE